MATAVLNNLLCGRHNSGSRTGCISSLTPLWLCGALNILAGLGFTAVLQLLCDGLWIQTRQFLGGRRQDKGRSRGAWCTGSVPEIAISLLPCWCQECGLLTAPMSPWGYSSHCINIQIKVTHSGFEVLLVAFVAYDAVVRD